MVTCDFFWMMTTSEKPLLSPRMMIKTMCGRSSVGFQHHICFSQCCCFCFVAVLRLPSCQLRSSFRFLFVLPATCTHFGSVQPIHLHRHFHLVTSHLLRSLFETQICLQLRLRRCTQRHVDFCSKWWSCSINRARPGMEHDSAAVQNLIHALKTMTGATTRTGSCSRQANLQAVFLQSAAVPQMSNEATPEITDEVFKNVLSRHACCRPSCEGRCALCTFAVSL